MSSNEKGGVLAAIKSTFIASDGNLRACWQLMAALFSWYALTLLTTYCGAQLLMKLLSAWGVTSANLHLTPLWIQYLVSYQASLYHAVTAAVAIISGARLMRKYRAASKGAAHTAASLMLGFFISIFISVALALLFMFTDSLRQYTGGGSISLHTLVSLAICAMSAGAEGLLAFGWLRKMAHDRGGRLAGYIAGTAMFFGMNILSASGPLGVINTLLTAILLCYISERYGTAPVVGIRTGWLWATSSLMSFSGSDTALLRLYTVSENPLTGGSAGLSSGFALTFICAVAIWFAIIRPALPGIKQKLRQK